MGDILMALECPRCAGSLGKCGNRLWQCAYCGTKYILLGAEYPIPGLMEVIDERDSGDVRGFYLFSAYHVRWDSPQEVKDEARVMGLWPKS